MFFCYCSSEIFLYQFQSLVRSVFDNVPSCNVVLYYSVLIRCLRRVVFCDYCPICVFFFFLQLYVMIGFFIVRLKKTWIFIYPQNAQGRLRLDCADADLSLPWAHVRRYIFSSCGCSINETITSLQKQHDIHISLGNHINDSFG